MEPPDTANTASPELPLVAEPGTLEARDSVDGHYEDAEGEVQTGGKRKRDETQAGEAEEEEKEGEDEAEDNTEEAKGEKRKLPEGDGEGDADEMTAKEKRQRGIATLESPERTSEHPEDEAQSPAHDPEEASAANDSTAGEQAPSAEDQAAKDAKDRWEADLKKFWDGEDGDKDVAKDADHQKQTSKDPWEDPWGEEDEKPGGQEGTKEKADEGAGSVPAKGTVPESDDEWGDWGAPGEKKEENLMEQIQKQREETAAGWEKEKWDPTSEKHDTTSDKGDEDEGDQKGDEEGQAEENWKGLFFTAPEDLADDEDENYWYNDLEHDAEWQHWPPNSKEALATTVLIQKIRARAGREKTPGGPFPSAEVADSMKAYMSLSIHEQKVLLAALLWIEVNVLEIKVVPPDLNEAIRMLLETEGQTLKQVSQSITDAALRTRAGSSMPTREVRKNSEYKVDELITHWHGLLPADLCDKEDLTQMVTDELGHAPCTVRVAALVHLAELTRLKGKKVFRSLDDLVVNLAKQRLPERAIESVCRLTLESAMALADNSMEAAADSEVRTEKVKVLRRLQKEWHLSPSEEDLAQLHMHKLDAQLLFLLNIERDVEQYWVKMLSRAKTDEARAKEMADYLNFGALLKPYLLEKPSARRKPVTAESGQELSCIDTARARSAVSEVLKLLHSRYGWVPELSTRRAISRTHWVGRLSALLTLACMPDCLHADAELRRLLSKEVHKQLGIEVLGRFSQWAKLEEGDGVVIKAPKVLDEATAEENRRLYKDFVPDPNKHPTAMGYQPMTPGGLGNISIMPSTPAPGTPGRGMRAAGTPAGPPPAGAYYRGAPSTPGAMGVPATPVGRVPGTPSGAPPGTPAPMFYAPGTPGGPPPATPGGMGMGTKPPGTPAGPPPPTPGGFGMRGAPGTPAGPPPATPAPGAVGSVPMTPVGVGAGRANAVPSTPRGVSGPVPMTPAGALTGAPGTPRVPGAPSTPKDSGTTTPRRIPATPAEALAAFTSRPGGTVGALGAFRIPATPAEALAGAAGRLPGTPAAAFASVGAVPQTPGGAVVPSTPAPGTGTAAPFTPVPGAAPFTPAPGAAPFTPAPGAAPFTPAPGAAPFTPAPGGSAAPMTPAAAR